MSCGEADSRKKQYLDGLKRDIKYELVGYVSDDLVFSFDEYLDFNNNVKSFGGEILLSVQDKNGFLSGKEYFSGGISVYLLVNNKDTNYEQELLEIDSVKYEVSE